jgi:hypothetical protein
VNFLAASLKVILEILQLKLFRVPEAAILTLKRLQKAAHDFELYRKAAIKMNFLTGFLLFIEKIDQ